MSISERSRTVVRKSRPSRRGRPGPIRLFVDSSGIGGIERHIAVLASGLERAGHGARVLLLERHGENPWLSQLNESGVDYDLLDGRFKSIVSLLRQEGSALLHTHGYKAGLLGRLAARVTGTPVVSTFHAGETGAFPVSLYQWADEWTSCLSTRISVSATIAQRLPFASTLAPNFIDAPPAPPEMSLPDSVGFVGRLSAEKGPDIFCQLAARHPQESIWSIYGDGAMRQTLERRHGDHVRFHGMVTDIAPVWRELGLLVISSYAEGLPMVALEALAAGVPVAATAVGALPKIIRHGENGWLFRPGDVDALDGIYREWASRRRADGAAWRKCAWRTARDGFGVDAGLERILEAYRAAGYHRARAFRTLQ